MKKRQQKKNIMKITHLFVDNTISNHYSMIRKTRRSSMFTFMPFDRLSCNLNVMGSLLGVNQAYDETDDNFRKRMTRLMKGV